MKQETMAAKMAALLGLDEDVQHNFAEKPKNKTLSPQMRAIQEEEIQQFRALEGIIYFLQAPELFTPKICKWCKEGFIVSRRNVAHCSMTCLKHSIEDLTGSTYSKSETDMEEIVADVWNGNEPLIVKNLDRIKKIINAMPVPNVDALNPVPQLTNPITTGDNNGTETTPEESSTSEGVLEGSSNLSQL